MTRMRTSSIAAVAALATLLGGSDLSAQNKYDLKVPGGLAFSEFKGYESWPLVSVSQDGGLFAAILANPAMIGAYQAGVPANGKPFPDGAKMAKIHWAPKNLETFSAGRGRGTWQDVDLMVKDRKRLKDSGGGGGAALESDPASHASRPAGTEDKPPQASDAKCGFGCHT